MAREVTAKIPSPLNLSVNTNVPNAKATKINGLMLSSLEYTILSKLNAINPITIPLKIQNATC